VGRNPVFAMELFVFDLDGTLLDNSSRISVFTRDTLRELERNGIAYTVATGRNLHAAKDIIADHGFGLPHVYTNGVLVWDPRQESISLGNFLTIVEARHILAAADQADLTPFVHTINERHQHAVFHPPVRHSVEERLLAVFAARTETPVKPLQAMPNDVQITNINMIGQNESVDFVNDNISNEPLLVAYSGPAMEDQSLKWIDIHHSEASKGAAIAALREQLGASRVICFGDSDNDLSMFAIADESYATSNAKDPVKAAATAVIGHHHEDGVARFLRERFGL